MGPTAWSNLDNISGSKVRVLSRFFFNRVEPHDKSLDNGTGGLASEERILAVSSTKKSSGSISSRVKSMSCYELPENHATVGIQNESLDGMHIMFLAMIGPVETTNTNASLSRNDAYKDAKYSSTN